MSDIDDDDVCWFAMKTTGFCTLLTICIILFGCSFSVLEPLEFGIEYNLNSRQIDPNSIFQGGRHFLGLGHEFKVFPANRLVFSFMADSRPVGGSEDQDCDLADECETGEEDCKPCTAGQMPHDEKDLIGENFIVKDGPLSCRTFEGLIIEIEAAVSLSLGLGRSAEDFTSGDAGDPPQPSAAVKDTLFGLFQVNGDSWGRDLISSSIAAAVRTEVSHHNALEFYLKREEIGTLVQTRVTSALQALNVTVHRTGLVAITLPTGLEEAIQDTELARQAKEAAIFAKETAEIEAITKVEVAKVERERLLHAALRNAERILLERVAQAIQIQYDTEQLGESFVDAKNTFGYNTSDQILLWKWLYTMQEANASSLVFDMPQPEQLAIGFEAENPQYATASPDPVVASSLLSLSGLNSTFAALEAGLSPTLAAVVSSTNTSTTATSAATNTSLRELMIEAAAGAVGGGGPGGPSPALSSLEQGAASAFAADGSLVESFLAATSSAPGSNGGSAPGSLAWQAATAALRRTSESSHALAAAGLQRRSLGELLEQYQQMQAAAQTVTGAMNLGL